VALAGTRVDPNAVELSPCHAFCAIDLPLIDGFFADTGLGGSRDFGSVIEDSCHLVDEFAQDRQGEYRILQGENRRFLGEADQGMLELWLCLSRILGSLFGIGG
jgi:hypothetical protein